MDVTNLTAEQSRHILDCILSNSYNFEDYFDYKNRILDILVNNNHFPDKDEYLLKMALNKLKADGYIDFVQKKEGVEKWQFIADLSASEGMSIRRNFNGHIFLATGGYDGEEQRRITATKENKDALTRSEGYASGLQTWTQNLANRTADLTFWTRLVAVGAIGLVLWEVVAFAIEHHWFSCP
jgi:hypothetical protein